MMIEYLDCDYNNIYDLLESMFMFSCILHEIRVCLGSIISGFDISCEGEVDQSPVEMDGGAEEFLPGGWKVNSPRSEEISSTLKEGKLSYRYLPVCVCLY